ncbi:MAG: hypothetical protein SXV54_15860 [Chloroflexota bacterium]|nr:hypothetical protein [Chloroflexota bacterium]
MRMQRQFNLTILFRPVFVFILFFLTACGTLEIGIEHTPTDADQVTQAATPGAEVIPTPAPTLTPIPAATELRVTFVRVTEHGNNVWLWVEGEREAEPLTKDGGVGDVKISDDGEIVAFTRGGGLWMVRSDGTEERRLVSAEDFAAMEAQDPELEVVLNRFEWAPGTHILAFNTRLQIEIGLLPNDDLHLVNADTLERTALLPPGEGGEFYYSPDGSQIAIATPGTISLMNADGSDRHAALTYTPVATYSEFRFYAQPVWAADSSALRVAIPPADPNVQPSPPTSIWHISTGGTPASMIRSITTGQMKQSVISPDLGYVAHLHYDQSDPQSSPMSSLLITDLDNGETVTYYPEASTGIQVTLEGGETITRYPEAALIYGWAPDSRHLAFLAYPPELPPQAQVGQLGGDVVPVYGDADAIIDVRWVDVERYLFLAQSPRGWDIFLGEISGPVKNVGPVPGADLPPAYDFAAPTTGSPLSTVSPTSTSTTGDSGDSPVPFGLIYQTAEGLWHVNADGESAQILDRPGAVASPDSAQLLYTEADDIWLADVATGERRNLTQTPDRSECCAQWWPGQSEVILFSSRTLEQDGPSFGSPTLARLDGSGYLVLDDQVSFAFPAPSSDGQTVAYDRAGQPWLYRFDTGSEPLDLTPYGLSSDPQLRVVSPAWSHDGRQLAWIIGDCRQSECQYSVGVFDLEAQTLELLHPYTPVGIGGQPPAPTWSLDDRWLAFGTWAIDAEDAGLWVVRVDGQAEEEYHLDAALGRADPNPVWSPDGRWLAFNSTPQGVGSGVWLAEVGTWSLHSTKLLPDAYSVDWVSPPGN